MVHIPQLRKKYGYDEQMAFNTLAVPFLETAKKESAKLEVRALTGIVAKALEHLETDDDVKAKQLETLILSLRKGGISLSMLQQCAHITMFMRVAAEELEAYIAEMLREEYKAQNPN